MVEEAENVVPVPDEAEVFRILSGPDNNIFLQIFDWIQKAIETIIEDVGEWIDKARSKIIEGLVGWYLWILNRIKEARDAIDKWIWKARDWIINELAPKFKEVWGWIVSEATRIINEIKSKVTEKFGEVSSTLKGWWDNIPVWFRSLPGQISGGLSGLGIQLEGHFDWLTLWLEDNVVKPVQELWSTFTEKLFDFPSWISGLLTSVLDWTLEDVPGSSPRIWSLFESVGRFFIKWIWDFPAYMLENPKERITYGLSESFKWVGDMFGEVVDTFNNAMIGMLSQLGPISPHQSLTTLSSVSKVGLAALGGLAGMTIAGEFLNPLSHLGLGHVSAMIYDMTNYKVITGVFIGALAAIVLKTPLTYFFNSIFRPWVLRQGDFMELLSREAFTEPEKLRNPELNESIRALAPAGGAALEAEFIGWYGFPKEYSGLFKELSFAPLRYFPLAGIARAGFWDTDWFIEALSRSGYSPTAREALLDMYREQVLVARQGPAMSQVRRLARDGFANVEQITAYMDIAAKLETMTESRLFALELEQEYAMKEMALDISLRCFSRGVITEGKCIANLRGLGMPSELATLHMFKEKLGLIRRVSIPQEAAVAPLMVVEE